MFYFNLVVGILFYWILFFSAPAISRFFNEPQLVQLVKVLATVMVIDSLTIIQRTILTRQIEFKLQTTISVISSVLSGILGIIMAFKGFGVWSLVVKQITHSISNTLCFWIWNRWRPLMVFSRQSFFELFSFGNKLLLSGLLDTLFRNIYLIVIGKFFSAQELGFYTRANQFQALAAENVSSIIGRVSYPVLARIHNDRSALKQSYKSLIKSTMLITFVVMMGMAAVAEPLVIVLIGEPWRPSIIYLQMLCFVGMMYPLHALNLNILKVQGRSDLFLRLEIIKKTLAISVILIGIFFGIKAMIAGMIVNTQLTYYLNSYWSGKFIGYPMKEQIQDILPSFFLAVAMGVFVISAGHFLTFGYLINLIILVAGGFAFAVVISEIMKIDAYLQIKEILYNNILKSIRIT